MLDVRKPIGLLFMILGALLFLYGQFFSQAIPFYTPDTMFPLKLNQPVGGFMFAFGLVMWQLARYVEVHTLDVELDKREKELDKIDRRRQKTIEKYAAAGDAKAADDAASVDAEALQGENTESKNGSSDDAASSSDESGDSSKE